MGQRLATRHSSHRSAEHISHGPHVTWHQYNVQYDRSQSSPASELNRWLIDRCDSFLVWLFRLAFYGLENHATVKPVMVADTTDGCRCLPRLRTEFENENDYGKSMHKFRLVSLFSLVEVRQNRSVGYKYSKRRLRGFQ
jgi:hypothetical protein